MIRLFFTRNRINYVSYLTNSTKKYLLSIKNHPYLKFIPVGADFDNFKPLDSKAMRMKLSLDSDKIYALYVGKYFKLKSVDLILKIYFKLKDKYNFSIIFVGGSKNNENDLYDQVANSGCPYFGPQEWIDMPIFYNAADFYIHPAFNPNFGGLDVSWIEALACNKPVLSPQLSFLDFNHSELGVEVVNENEFLNKTEWMIANCKKYTKCREAAFEHLDANSAIMKQLMGIYEEIYQIQQ